MSFWLAAMFFLSKGQKEHLLVRIPDVRLELEQVGSTKDGAIELRCTIVNRGTDGVFFAPGFLNGELLEVRFVDAATGRKIHFEGDDIMYSALLSPEENFALNPGMYVGIEKHFKLISSPPNIKASAFCGFKDFDHYKARKLWEGELVSKSIVIK